MYLRSIALAQAVPCLAEPGRIIVTGRPDRAMDEALPYVATLPGVIGWNPRALQLTFRRPRGFMTLHRDRVFITQVRDADEGMELLEALRDAVNAVWERRAELTAVTQEKRRPSHLDVLQLLPRTNCKQCGEATCLAFAVGLVQKTRRPAECPPLRRDAFFSQRRTTLEAMI